MKATRTHRKMARAIIIFLAALALASWVAPAQFTLDWSTVDGGGTSSTGGVYSVTGTIGQADAGAVSGGSFALQGGFWVTVAVVQTPGAPVLSITASNNTLILAWPAPSTRFELQENPLLVSTNWTTVTTTPVVVGSQKRVIITSPVENRFYRLHKP